MKTRRMIPIFAASAAIAATLVVAQVEPREATSRSTAASTASTSQPDVVDCSYEVGDLIDLFRPRRRYATNWPGLGDILDANPKIHHEFNDDYTELDERVAAGEQLMSVITDFVAVDSWKMNGGTIGAIQIVQWPPTLIVSQTAENQVAVVRRLTDIRKSRDAQTMVSTRATWLMLDAKDVRAIYDRARKTAPAHATMGPAIVDDATLDRATVYAQGQTTCFNGQTVSIASERERSIVTNVTPIVGAGAVGYSPTTERAKGGVTLQLTPQLSGDDASVVLDLRSIVTETRGPTTEPTTQPAIDPHDVTRQSIGTTVRLPLGQRVLVAGMTMEPSTAGDGRALYLVVEVDTVR